MTLNNSDEYMNQRSVTGLGDGVVPRRCRHGSMSPAFVMIRSAAPVPLSNNERKMSRRWSGATTISGARHAACRTPERGRGKQFDKTPIETRTANVLAKKWDWNTVPHLAQLKRVTVTDHQGAITKLHAANCNAYSSNFAGTVARRVALFELAQFMDDQADYLDMPLVRGKTKKAVLYDSGSMNRCTASRPNHDAIGSTAATRVTNTVS